jgi:DNA polymerase V
MRPLFALVDCNCFYVSCERVFHPRLASRPVVVLSNNDGCIVSRSDEAKKLGIPMGECYFKVKPLIQAHQVAVFSSNYALYGDMSQRVMSTLEQFSPRVEVYSIDESFLDFRGLGEDAGACARRLRAAVRRGTGIPVGVGVAETKTLAKLANRIAKKTSALEGVLDLADVRDRDALLESVAVGDVWGIGRRWSVRLQEHGITTARHLRDAPDLWVRKQLGVVAQRIVHELRGTSCLPLDGCPQPKHAITCSRSFSPPVETLDGLQQAITEFTARAAEKLRKQSSAAGVLSVFIRIGRVKRDSHGTGATVVLPRPTADTLVLAEHARRAVERLYRPESTFLTTGVTLTALRPATSAQLALFPEPGDEKRQRLMAVIDRLNRERGQGTVGVGSSLLEGWSARCGHRSPRYTTRWDELLTVG